MTPITIHDPRIAEFLRYWHESGRAAFDASRARFEKRNGRPCATPPYDEDFHETRTPKDRKKYIALDRGTSGVYLLEKATGLVWDIAGYGVRHSFRHFGTLDAMLAKWKAEFGELAPLAAAPPPAEPEAPVRPKITLALLTAAFLSADVAADAAQGTEDGGTCNFDTAVVRLPGVPAKLVQEAATLAGIRVDKQRWLGGPCWFLNSIGRGQGNMRSRMARAAYKTLESYGLDASEYLQMD